MPPPSTTIRPAIHDASEPSSPPELGSRKALIGLGLLGAAAFAITLLATLPASLVASSIKPGTVSVSGTAWSGEALLRDGDLVTWQIDPVGSILSLSAKADVAVTGETTDLTAKLTTGPGGTTLSNIAGVAGWSMVRTAWPEIGLACDIAIRFDDATATFGGAAPSFWGRATGSEGTCIDGGSGKPFNAPATQAEAVARDGGSDIKIALAVELSELLADIAITASGDIKATVLPRALALIPGTNASGPVVYEVQAR